jgi:hypothetical protein
MLVAVGVGVFLAAPAARAAIITVPLVGAGGDSGWDATYDNSVVDMTVDLVSLQKGFVVIEITKEFGLPPNSFTGLFPTILIDFAQRAQVPAVGTIVIADETIRNRTGGDWTDFHWEVLDEGDAWFDVALSGQFGIQPPPQFQQHQWATLPQDLTKADALNAFDGLVANGSTYFPGQDDSDLVIRTNPEAEGLRTFTLKEYPTPEPATLALVGLGLAAVLARRESGDRKRGAGV